MRLALWCLAAALAGPAAAMEGVVTRVSDGDTLWVRPIDGGRPRKLRVQGIDAPESCQAWGREAHQQLSALVLGRRVHVDEGAFDAHGRRLVRLMRGDLDVGAWMVRHGHAWSYRFRGDPGPYVDEERAARAQRRGLFHQVTPTPPRDFRRTHGPCT